MSGNRIDRRNFLKIMGWGSAGAAVSACDMPTTITLEEGKEKVVSYLVPEEYVIPGIGVWYASTCVQCSAACGVHGRVREGRVLKIEGNPNSEIGRGGLCQMGQSAVQNHYNPDRIQKPMLRKNGALVEVTWDEALSAIEEKAGKNSKIEGNRVAWLTGNISGHQAVLLKAYLDSFDTANHYAHETINDSVANVVNKDMFGEVQPAYNVSKAKVILSLGADLLGASASPVHFAAEYAEFRSAVPRGMLIQVEPKMTLTGANADLWAPAIPGTEGSLALGIANELLAKHSKSGESLPAGLKRIIDEHTTAKTAEITGIQKSRIEAIAKILVEKAPSLVMVGATAANHKSGYQTVAAAMMLNVILGNIGKTVVSTGEFPFPQLLPIRGNSRDLMAFSDGAGSGAFDIAFIYGTNPVYTAPKFLDLEAMLGKVPFKVVLSQFYDETTKLADVVLPLASSLEDWGTHVPPYQPAKATIAIQQPLMDKLYPETKGFGDSMLALLKMRNADEYSQFDDYYAYLRSAFSAMPSEHKGGLDDDKFWMQILQKGVLPVNTGSKTLTSNALDITSPTDEKDINYPLHLIPSGRLGMWDGRHANIPWLQEAPDQIAKVVWGSWAELHPKTAARLGVKMGDLISVASVAGVIEVPVYLYRGVHPDAVAVPMGQGHTEYGRYAKGRGVNPLKIVSSTADEKTGELALYGTRVKITKVDRKPTFDEKMIRFGGSETQVGRKLVASVSAEQFNRTEGA